MLNDLKAVLGAVAKKDFVPALTHFHIEDGRIYGFNGSMAISTPTDLAVTATPKATSFVKAIEALPEGKEIVLNLTATGRLSIKAGNFRAYVECHEESRGLVKIEPKGENVPLLGELMPVLRRLSPFMSIDASRPWAQGIRFAGQGAYATNNIVLIEHWLTISFPEPFVLPAESVKEMLRIGKEPISMQACANSVAFHYDNGAWLRTQLVDATWPDLTRILDHPSTPTPFPDGFFDGVKRLSSFTDEVGRLFLRGGTLATHADEGTGALVDLEDFGGLGCYQIEQIAKLNGVANTIDLNRYPLPSLFFGDMIRGAIVGMRV